MAENLREAHVEVIHYLKKICPPIRPDIINLCDKAIEQWKHMPLDKLARWTGYIQGSLIAEGVTTIDKERDRTRPIFTPFYKPLQAYFGGVLVDVDHPVVHWECGEPRYVMRHIDETYGEHPGGEVDRDEEGKIKYGSV